MKRYELLIAVLIGLFLAATHQSGPPRAATALHLHPIPARLAHDVHQGLSSQVHHTLAARPARPALRPSAQPRPAASGAAAPPAPVPGMQDWLIAIAAVAAIAMSASAVALTLRSRQGMIVTAG